MVRATTPSDSKLRSKGVQSVRQHVTTLNNYIDISIEELKESLRTTLCDSELILDENALASIERIEESYYSPLFIYGNKRSQSQLAGNVVVKERRIEGVGEFNLNITLDGNLISNVNIAGDFFVIGDVDTMLLSRLKGVALECDALLVALDGVDCSAVIMNLKKEQLINLLFN